MKSEVIKMTAYEIATIILIPLALSMGYAFKKHNEELLEQEKEEQKSIISM